MIALLQARMSSNRMPGKVLLPFDGSTSILTHIIKNIKKTNLIEKIVVLTSTHVTDNVIENYCKKNKYDYFRGPLKNVIKRFIQAGNYFNAKHFLRVCCDSPFLSRKLIENLVNSYAGNDYDSYAIRGIPGIKTHLGIIPEIVSLKSLELVYKQFNNAEFNEHVTLGVYSNKELFKVNLLAHKHLDMLSGLRLTVDDPEDYDICQTIIKNNKFDIFDNPKTLINNLPSKLKERMFNQIIKYEK